MAASKRGNPADSLKARSIASDELSGRINATGMIQPGSHPEFDQPTPLDKIGAWIDKHFGTKHKPIAPPK